MSTTPSRRRPALAAALIALTGCTGMQAQVADWPALEIRTHTVAAGEIFGRCAPYIPVWQRLLGVLPLACAEIDLSAATCDVYIADTSTPDTIAHELEHCRGADHNGVLQAALDDHREAK